jgi:hypothetical protein
VGPSWTQIRTHGATSIETVGVGGQKTSSVGRTDLQAREAIERALKNQMREGDCGLWWIADHVAEVAVAFEPMTELLRRPIALRMNEDEHTQLLRLSRRREYASNPVECAHERAVSYAIGQDNSNVRFCINAAGAARSFG